MSCIDAPSSCLSCSGRGSHYEPLIHDDETCMDCAGTGLAGAALDEALGIRMQPDGSVLIGEALYVPEMADYAIRQRRAS